MKGLVLVVASAWLFGWAFPPLGMGPLAFVALAPLFVALRRAPTTRRALALAWLWSLVAAWNIGDWMPGAIQTYYLQPWLVGLGFFVFVTSTMAAPYYMAFALAARALSTLPFVVRPLLVAAAWVAAELGRGRLFTGTDFFIGNPWGLVGYTQVGTPAVAQVAALAGVYGIGFVIAATNAGLAELALGVSTRRRGAEGLAVACAPAALALLYGALVLRDAAANHDAGIPVVVVQGNADVGSRWRSDLYGVNFDLYARLTAQALGATQARLVFWPEAALTLFLEREEPYQRALARLLAPWQAQLVVGAPRAPTPDQPPYFNSVYVVEPSGVLSARYDKRYLVPFAERFPLSSIALLRRSFGRVREFTPGEAPPVVATAAGLAGVAVCNEAMLPEVVGQSVVLGATYLVNPSNDTWIPVAKFAEQQFDIVRLRAIEQRRFLVRASTSGPSAVVDPWGRVVVRSGIGERTTLSAAITPRTDRTLYSRTGDAFGCGCVAATLVGVWWARRGRRRGRGSSCQVVADGNNLTT